ncbi:MAG: class I SAM-dependent methyltransferase [Mycobacteriales bacterium]
MTDRAATFDPESPAFATDAATAAYYEQRAAEYDEWWNDLGQYAERGRNGWSGEVLALVSTVRALPAARTLDVACGTGYLTRHLTGYVVGLDQSPSMVEIAQSRLPGGLALLGDALDLPFAAGSFTRVFTGHFYGHLPPSERGTFLTEAGRVGPELIVVDSARRPGIDGERWQSRVLNDGSQHRVFKRYLTGPQLAGEIGGTGVETEVLLDGEWFVAARAIRTG